MKVAAYRRQQKSCRQLWHSVWRADERRAMAGGETHLAAAAAGGIAASAAENRRGEEARQRRRRRPRWLINNVNPR